MNSDSFTMSSYICKPCKEIHLYLWHFRHYDNWWILLPELFQDLSTVSLPAASRLVSFFFSFLVGLTCTHCCINNGHKDLQYSTWNSLQCYIITQIRKEFEKRIDSCITEPLCCTLKTTDNIVNHLYTQYSNYESLFPFLWRFGSQALIR